MVRWGVLGTANIAGKVARAMSLAENAELVAVASRSTERAKEWAAERDVPRYYGSYDELMRDGEIDALYIPLPPSMHAEWTIRAAEAGKHVLCEKPLALTASEAQKMADACARNNVQLMDGVMWVHHERTDTMRGLIDEGRLGEVCRVTAAFSFNWGPEVPTKNIRAQTELGGGALGDLGYYCVRAILWAVRELPKQVYAKARYMNGVDVETSALLTFTDGRCASLDCAFTVSGRSWCEVAGTQAALRVEDFVVPNAEERSAYGVGTRMGSIDMHEVGPCIQEQRMVERFSRIVESGRLEPDWVNEACDTMRVCEAIAKAAVTGKQVELG